jgi:hypothetical protein
VPIVFIAAAAGAFCAKPGIAAASTTVATSKAATGVSFISIIANPLIWNSVESYLRTLRENDHKALGLFLIWRKELDARQSFRVSWDSGYHSGSLERPDQRCSWF